MIGICRKILIWLSFTFIFLIPLSQYLSVRLLLFLVLFSILAFKTKIFSYVFRQSWDLLLYTAILIIGLIYSEDKVQGLRVLETSFSLVAVPFLFFGFTKGESHVYRYSTTFFTAGIFIACIVVSINAFINYLSTGSFESFKYYELTDLLGLQPTYMAYYVIMSITYLVFVLYYNKNLSPFIFIESVLFLFVILLLTGGRTAFISLILVSSYFLLKYLLDLKTIRKSYTVILVACIMIGTIVFSNTSMFKSVMKNSDYWERSILWKSAINANPNPIFGVGTGDYNLVLNEYYRSQELVDYASGNYNSHNQYLHQYFSNGIFGLIALLIIIGRPIYLSFKSQNPLGILIVFPFVIYGMTEVFLGRYQGVVFFVLCHQIAVSHYYSSKQNFDLKAVSE